ncbi:MAG TPA: 3-dehydroquinate dehydratase, partial [Candidatus Aerophobetes bacterium]|nr:3-dehydroquinate dehydratase [Candidatus Aerophobetes bacterium]
MIDILVIHGPNLNLLGKRESGWYGTVSLDEINELINKKAKELNCKVKIVQSNHEGEIVDAIQRAREWAKG